jgi:Ig-like domain from next to BRCA1 gene
MKTKLYWNLAVLTALALFLSACGGAPTPDAAAIATSAVQTVEARYTQQTAQKPTETTVPTPEATSISASTTPKPAATSTPQPVDSNGKPCYAASVQDITIPDGKIIAPGSTFTKTWRMFNKGNCVWDSSYSLIFDSGDAMGTVVKVPFTTRVLPEQSVDLSVDLTAPTTDGLYTGYWRIATPFGGTFGVGTYDQSIFVKIRVSPKPDRDFGIDSVVYDWTRDPQKGCNSNGATYTFSATLTANAPGEISYHWDRSPDDGTRPSGILKFKEAGPKTIYWSWILHPEAVQGIDRSVSIIVDTPVKQTFDRVTFHYTCEK